MQTQRHVLYQYEWQKLRTSLCFTSLRHIQGSIYTLQEYITKGSIADPEVNRVYRALNLMAATYMGLIGGGKRGAAGTQQVVWFRKYLSAQYAQLNRCFIARSHKQEVTRLRRAKREEPKVFARIERSLQRRFEKSGYSPVRVELIEYLDIMKEAASTRRMSRRLL